MKSEHIERLHQYAKLKLQIRELEAQAEELNTLVQAIMDENQVEEVEVGDMGKLIKSVRRVWKYSPDIEALKAVYDRERKQAEQTGEGATYTEKAFITFRTNAENSTE